MARRLIRLVWGVAGPGRAARFAALVTTVALVHGCVTRGIADRLEEFAAAARMPPRIEVAYVRTLEPEAPPVAAPAPPPPPPPKRRVARPRPAKPASAPEPRIAAAESDPASRREESPASASATEPADMIEALAAAAAAASAAPAPGAKASEPASEPARLAESPPGPGASAPDAVGTGAGPSVAAASAPSGEPFDWPASTRVSYQLTGNYRGDVTGNAQVEWIRVGTRYQVNLDLLVGPEFAPIIARRMSSEGDLTADGLTPSRYDEDTQVMFRERRRVSILFEPDGVVLANGERRERWRGVQDTASQFVQLTYLFTMHPELLKVGGTVEVPLALARSMDRWIYDVLEEAVIQAPFGPLQTFHLKPRRAVPRPGELSAEIWFSPQLRYLPVRIRIVQDPQTYLDLVIARKPELASR